MTKLNKIIFIDDDEWTNDYHKYLSERAGVANETLFFTSGETALAYLSELATKYDFPDLIFIDIHMPGMGGEQFAGEVQELPAFNEERTVLAYLTGSVEKEEIIFKDNDAFLHFYSKKVADFDIGKIVHEIFGT